LANKDDFDDAAKARVKKDANTLAALALTLGLHDADHRLKSSAPALLKAAQKLAAADEYEAAQSAFQTVKAAATRNGSAAAGTNDSLKWARVASLRQLMQQVPVVNAALRRGVNADVQRFKKLQPQLAGQSATLAAIAQTIAVDTTAVKKPADSAKWYQFTTEMRDAAGAVNQAVHGGDQPAATIAMTRLAKSCEACHAVFRKEKD
jgi:cytochrome c556